MGSVYRVRDRELDEVVALKMLRRDVLELPGMLERFRREVKLARRVTHHNVARTYDIGMHEGEKFLTMELVEGQSLGAQFGEQGPMAAARLAALGCAICAGLEAAHAAGVVHRDLKPDNVMVARDGRVVITDFGIACACDASAPARTLGAIGTPAYMAPEQVESDEPIDARADLYALGVVLYELATGDLPWHGRSAFTLAAARLASPPPDPRAKRPDLPAGLAGVILRCMARKPEDRHSSAAEVASALAVFCADVGNSRRAASSESNVGNS
ncbi:MAG: serine/threonine protein kinase, partial [Myxococcales bacterium]|nr:serine/threonine protein kinase [Myxococcales bacterium]